MNVDNVLLKRGLIKGTIVAPGASESWFQVTFISNVTL